MKTQNQVNKHDTFNWCDFVFGKWLIILIFMMSLISTSALAEPIQLVRSISTANYVSGGIGGIGTVGTGTIAISGINGSITHAYLYWHGIERAGGTYDNPTIQFNGQSVTGVGNGDSSTNCWGPGTSRAYRADVTSLVTGDGNYLIEDLASQPNSDVNGASLVVVFTDTDPNNNRDLVFFEGNDSTHPDGYPGEDAGWNASLPPINYGGGQVFAELHVADGQSANDGTLVFTTPNGSLSITDNSSLWDGNSVPSAGNSRTPTGSLWDIHQFDITAAFGAVTGPVDLTMTGYQGDDCLALILLILKLEAGTAPALSYTVTYNGNGNTGGNAPDDPNSPYPAGETVTVLGNTGNLILTGYTFNGWNTVADGSGTSYSAGNTFSMPSSNVVLYAQWSTASAAIPTLSEWGMIIFSLMLAGSAIWMIRRRQIS